MDFSYRTIGIIHTPFQQKENVPIQSKRSNFTGRVEVFPQFSEGLEGIEDFSHIYLLYRFHRSEPSNSLKVKPFLDDQQHGVFTTRYPYRPNPLGISVVQIIERQGNMLSFIGADMLDETPLLDIKPYIPDFDYFQVEKIGWYQTRKYC